MKVLIIEDEPSLNKAMVDYLHHQQYLCESVSNFHDALEKTGIKHTYYESPGTGHEWQTWRRSLRQFAGMLFK